MNRQEQIDQLEKTVDDWRRDSQKLVDEITDLGDKFSRTMKVTQFRSAVSAARSQRYFVWFWAVYGLGMLAAAVYYWREGVWLNAVVHTAFTGLCGWMLWLAHKRHQKWTERAREDLREVPRDALGRIMLDQEEKKSYEIVQVGSGGRERYEARLEDGRPLAHPSVDFTPGGTCRHRLKWVARRHAERYLRRAGKA